MDFSLTLTSMGSFDLLFAVKSFIALFVIVDVIGLVPIFLSLLSGYGVEDKKAIVKLAVRIAAAALLVLTLAGNVIFQVLGIGFYSFKIAGGVILLIISVEMLFGRRTRTGFSEDMQLEKLDVAVTPMAIPLMTGPGAITTSIILLEEANGLINDLVLVANILLVFWVSYEVLKRIDLVYRILGHIGTRVVTRIMGLMLAAMSVQFMVSGAAEAVKVLFA